MLDSTAWTMLRIFGVLLLPGARGGELRLPKLPVGLATGGCCPPYSEGARPRLGRCHERALAGLLLAGAMRTRKNFNVDWPVAAAAAWLDRPSAGGSFRAPKSPTPTKREKRQTPGQDHNNDNKMVGSNPRDSRARYSSLLAATRIRNVLRKSIIFS